MAQTSLSLSKTKQNSANVDSLFDDLALHTCNVPGHSLYVLQKMEDASSFSHGKHVEKMSAFAIKQRYITTKKFKLRFAYISFLLSQRFREIRSHLTSVLHMLKTFHNELVSAIQTSHLLYQQKVLHLVDVSLKCSEKIFELNLSLKDIAQNFNSDFWPPSFLRVTERMFEDAYAVIETFNLIVHALIYLRVEILKQKCEMDISFVTFTAIHLYELSNRFTLFVNSSVFSKTAFASGLPSARLKGLLMSHFSSTVDVHHFIDVFVKSRYQIVTQNLLHLTHTLFCHLQNEKKDENENSILSSDTASLNSISTNSSNGKPVSQTKIASKILRKTFTKLFSDENSGFNSFLLEVFDVTKVKSLPASSHLYASFFKGAKYATVISPWSGPFSRTKKTIFFNYFTEKLWGSVCKSLYNCYAIFYFENARNSRYADARSIASPILQRDVIWKTKLRLTEDGLTPECFLSGISELVIAITSCKDIQDWDEGMNTSMGLSIKDHFRHKKVLSPSLPSSCTFKKSLTNQTSVQDLLKILNRKDMLIFQHSRRKVERSILYSLHTFMNFFMVILPARRQLYLSSGSWEPFFVVTSLDLKFLMLYLDHLLQNLQVVFPAIEIKAALLFQFYETCKCFEERSFNLLVHAFSHRSRQLFKQNMPNVKTWRRRGSNVKVYQANTFVTVALQPLFSPFLEACACLSRLVMMRILCRCVTSFLKHWMEYILEEQILFSLFGCQQLLFDLHFFLQTFENEDFGLSVDEVSDIHALPIVQQFRNAIVLLSCQPKSTKEKRDFLGSELHGSVVGSTQSILSQVSIEKEFSTQTAHRLKKWKEMIHKKGFEGGILMDLSKAFYTIIHKHFIAKLDAYGFDRSFLRLMLSYLSARKPLF